MFDTSQDCHSEKNSHLGDHLANERTFLSWIRTSIGIMAFGFVIERFTLFTKKLAVLIGESHLINASPSARVFKGYSSILGIFVVAFGVLLAGLAFIQYNKITKQIENNSYTPCKSLKILLIVAVLLSGMCLVLYLISSL